MNKMRSWISLTLFIVPLFITACAEQTTSVVEVPTRVVLNTPTPTLTATASPTPLPITPTMTIRPTNTNRPSVTPTASRTSTATITATATPTRVIATATNTLTPSPTVTATPTATATPVVTATPDVAQIINFSANPTAGAAGSAVTLSWETRNVDSVRIDQLNAQGAVTQTFSVAFNGSLPVTLPNQPGQILYRLVAIRLGAQVTRDVAVTVQVVCSTSWFFGNNLAPADAGCPDGPAISATGAVQPFERGLMLYINAAGLNKLYGLVYSTGSTTNGTYMVYDNGWDGVTIYPGGACPNPSGCTPPAGLVEPQGGFSWLYYNTNGPTGPWWGATGIGWGTGGADPNSAQTYQEQLTVTQGGQQITPFFILVPGYGVLRFSGTPITGTWQRVPGT